MPAPSDPNKGSPIPRRTASERTRTPEIAPIRIAPAGRYQAAAERIVGLIGTGAYPSGAMLPPERTLAEALAISRSTLREAIAVLEALGIVRTRTNHGIRITRAAVATELPWGSARLQASPKEHLAALRLVETEVAGIVAFTTTSTTQQPLVAIVDEMESRLAEGVPIATERLAFHTQLADLCGQNRALAGMVRQGWADLARSGWDPQARGLVSPDDMRREVGLLRLLLRRLREGDPPLARARMTSYLRFLEKLGQG